MTFFSIFSKCHFVFLGGQPVSQSLDDSESETVLLKYKRMKITIFFPSLQMLVTAVQCFLLVVRIGLSSPI